MAGGKGADGWVEVQGEGGGCVVFRVLVSFGGVCMCICKLVRFPATICPLRTHPHTDESIHSLIHSAAHLTHSFTAIHQLTPAMETRTHSLQSYTHSLMRCKHTLSHAMHTFTRSQSCDGV